MAGIRIFQAAHRLTVDAQAGNAAIRIHIDAQVRPYGIAGNGVDDMVAARPECGGRQDFSPFCRRERLDVISRRNAGFDGNRRRVIADEVAGINVETANAALDAKLDERPVVAGGALAARLPAIHPLAVGVEFARHELSRFRVEHARGFGKEVVGGSKCLGAEAQVGEIDRTQRPIGQIGGRGDDGGSGSMTSHGFLLNIVFG